MPQAWPAGIVGGVFILIGLIHLYWLLGGRRGFAISVPFKPETQQPFFRPRKPEIAAVILVFWAIAAVLLMYGELLPALGPDWLLAAASRFIAAVLLLRAIGEFRTLGFFKRIRSTPFARMDTLVYSPLCLLLSALTVWMLLLP
jgi:hypothetical protein